MNGLSVYKEHLDLAAERFSGAKEMMENDREHTAAHLYINSAINYHNALCQKFLKSMPSHKQHMDTTHFKGLERVMGKDLPRYKEAYAFLIGHKSKADYGTEFSAGLARQVERRATFIKETAEALL